jgi:hypothetical protein
VSLAQILNNLGAGSGYVSENPGNTRLRNKLIENRLREPVWVKGESLIQNDAGHLPMTGGRVFAVGTQGTLPK